MDGDLRAERVGFEPTRRYDPPTRFPVAHLKPLGHLSEAVDHSGHPLAETVALKIKPMAVDGTWNVYLSGEIHSDWRQRIADGLRDAGLPVELLAPVTDHAASDDVGADILGEEDEPFWRDHKGAGVNAVRTQTLLRRADVVVVRFGDKYRQWNAAFEAGYAAALGKPIVTLHDPDLTHALKEVDRAAMAVAETPEQVVDVLRYAISG
jgi:YtoQ family protein